LLKKHKELIGVQAFKFDSVLSEAHLLSAVWHAWNGFKNGLTISDSLSIEFLLYLSGQRQISKAIQIFGLKDEVKKFSIIFFHENEIFKENLNLSYISNSKISVINKLTISDSMEKRIHLASIFEYNLDQNSKVLEGEDGFNKLENYILTSISNLVFETSKIKTFEQKKN